MRLIIPSLHLLPKAGRLAQGLFWICCAVLFLTPQSLPAKDTLDAKKGDTFYTQFSFFYEDNTHLTTNYRKGTFVPVNTEVTFVKAGSNSLYFKLPNGEQLKVENVKNYSGENIEGIFKRTVGKEKVDLSKYSAKEKQNILTGEVDAEMSKDAVIKALGYPPKHQTPSLESDNWRYWRNRFKTFIVHFENGKVTSIKN